MNWNEFKTKYKQEIRVGLIVLIATITLRILKDIFNNKQKLYVRTCIKEER